MGWHMNGFKENVAQRLWIVGYIMHVPMVSSPRKSLVNYNAQFKGNNKLTVYTTLYPRAVVTEETLGESLSPEYGTKSVPRPLMERKRKTTGPWSEAQSLGCVTE